MGGGTDGQKDGQKEGQKEGVMDGQREERGRGTQYTNKIYGNKPLEKNKKEYN